MHVHVVRTQLMLSPSVFFVFFFAERHTHGKSCFWCILCSSLSLGLSVHVELKMFFSADSLPLSLALSHRIFPSEWVCWCLHRLCMRAWCCFEFIRFFTCFVTTLMCGCERARNAKISVKCPAYAMSKSAILPTLTQSVKNLKEKTRNAVYANKIFPVWFRCNTCVCGRENVWILFIHACLVHKYNGRWNTGIPWHVWMD